MLLGSWMKKKMKFWRDFEEARRRRGPFSIPTRPSKGLFCSLPENRCGLMSPPDFGLINSVGGPQGRSSYIRPFHEKIWHPRFLCGERKRRGTQSWNNLKMGCFSPPLLDSQMVRREFLFFCSLQLRRREELESKTNSTQLLHPWGNAGAQFHWGT